MDKSSTHIFNPFTWIKRTCRMKSDFVSCATHKKEFKTIVSCKNKDHHDKIMCPDCTDTLNCADESHTEQVIWKRTLCSSCEVLENKIVSQFSALNDYKLYLISRLGKNGQVKQLPIPRKTDAIKDNVNIQSDLCEKIMLFNEHEMEYAKEIIPLFNEKNKTKKENEIYVWKLMRLSKKVADSFPPDLQLQPEIEGLKQFEKHIAHIQSSLDNTGKRPDEPFVEQFHSALIYDTGKTTVTKQFIQVLTAELKKKKINLIQCGSAFEQVGQLMPLIVLCLLDSRFESDIKHALSSVEVDDYRRIGFISLHCKAKEVPIEDYTDGIIKEFGEDEYANIGLVIDCYFQLDQTTLDKTSRDTLKTFIHKFRPFTGSNEMHHDNTTVKGEVSPEP